MSKGQPHVKGRTSTSRLTGRAGRCGSMSLGTGLFGADAKERGVLVTWGA